MRQLLDKVKLRFRIEAVSTLVAKILTNNRLKQDIATLWGRYYRARNSFAVLRAQHGNLALVLLVCFLICVSILFTFSFQSELESYFSSKDNLSGLRSLLLTLGGSLIGAAAIAFTLIMFSMQVNVERLPHGLFRKFSTDLRIMCSFGTTFTLAVAVTSISLIIPDESWVAAAILSSLWLTVVVLLLFLYAYRRALSLINPIQQLEIMIKDADTNMKAWVRWSKRTAPLLEKEVSREGDEGPKITHDLARLALFQRYPSWTASAERAIRYAMSFATRYAEQGDHDVSSAALTSAVKINVCYVNAKGKTFFDHNILIDNPLATDSFINNTLEYLRQAVKAGVSREDEQFIEQTFSTMERLVEVYISIDYCNRDGSKEHAVLAAAYLSDAVESIIPHNMADVLMEGTRLIGRASLVLLSYGDPTSAKSSVDTISVLASTGTVNDKYRPVTLVAMEKLSSLTFSLFRSSRFDITFPAKYIRDSVTMVSKLFLNVPDTSLGQIHNQYLGPYYSDTNENSLLHRLGSLASAISNKASDDVDAKRVIRNVEIWAEDLYSTEKDLLLLAIEKRSSFTIDIINWIENIADILMVISNADACDGIVKEKLQKHARYIIGTLSFIPKDKGTVTFIECYKFTESLFNAAMKGYRRECLDVFDSMQRCLLDWGFKAGRHNISWPILEHSIYGLATLALTTDLPNPELLKGQIKNILSKPDTPDKETKDNAAREVRSTAATLYRDGHSYSQIEYQMRKVDMEKMQLLLNELADLISPKKTDEKVEIGIH
jgi:hypothetical protein